MSMSTFNVRSRMNDECGGALVVSLLMLLVMTLLGVTAMQVTSLEEKMAGNMRDRNLAFQAAESALRGGEALLRSATSAAFNCAQGLYKVDDYGCDGTPDSVRVWDAVDWNSTGAVAYSGGNLAALAANPRYIIEELAGPPQSGTSLEAGVPSDGSYYRITARGVGGTTNAVVLLQSTFKR
jgi:type IV pilus assembly protein PilX